MRRKEEALANVRAQGLSQSANFGAPQQNAFSFGASAPAPANNGANGFGSNNAFGGGATNSFPPAQPAAPSNTFSSSSFPAFGGSNQGTGFNPTPPSSAGFNFTAGGANPFANANSAPATNGNTPAPAFGGSSIFGNDASTQGFVKWFVMQVHSVQMSDVDGKVRRRHRGGIGSPECKSGCHL